MAAPHVSGVIAAFLSIRKEFIGKPEDVEEFPRDGHRPQTRPVLPGPRSGGPHACHSVCVIHAH